MDHSPCARDRPTLAVILSMRQQALYQATSQVLLNRQNLSAILSGVTDPNTYYQPERLAQTQAELARVPEVGQRVIRAAGLRIGPRRGSSARPPWWRNPTPTSSTSPSRTDRATAARLANIYASVFTQYRSELDGKAIQLARQGVSERIDQLEAQGDTSSVVYRNLVEKEQQLQTIEALQTSTLSVVREAPRASRFSLGRSETASSGSSSGWRSASSSRSSGRRSTPGFARQRKSPSSWAFRFWLACRSPGVDSGTRTGWRPSTTRTARPPKPSACCGRISTSRTSTARRRRS